jgi:hypothetical protein
MVFVGLDDTDNLTSRGTGHLARHIASVLAADYTVLGVTRHQLLEDPRVPCTKRNSCAAIILDVESVSTSLMERIQILMLDDFQPGSDPGLCLAQTVPDAVIEFGRRVQTELVTQTEARSLAKTYNIPLIGLGGDEDGVIGALAAVGLAASGDDGRYVEVGHIRELNGLQPVSTVLAAGVVAVQTFAGQPVGEGLVQTDKLRPARRNGLPVAVVEQRDDYWQPLKVN